MRTQSWKISDSQYSNLLLSIETHQNQSLNPTRKHNRSRNPKMWKKIENQPQWNRYLDQKTKTLKSLETERWDQRQLLHRIRETRSERENVETETSIAVSWQIFRCSSSPGRRTNSPVTTILTWFRRSPALSPSSDSAADLTVGE